MSAVDEISADLQWVGVSLYEPRFGRTKLVSLAEYDDIEFDTMHINSFHILDDYKKIGCNWILVFSTPAI